MLKFIIASFLLLVSNNLFSQRLCEETFKTRGLYKTQDPNIIIIAGLNQLKWYNVETCEFMDSLLFEGLTSASSRISNDAETAIIYYKNENNKRQFRKYNLVTLEQSVNFNLEEVSEYYQDCIISPDGTKLLVLSDVDNKIVEYSTETGEELRSITTLAQGLSEIKVSNDGSLVGIYSEGADFDKVIYLYESESLELITSIPFTNYFDEADIETSNGFEFDPITTDIYLGSENSLIKINPVTLDKKVILENQPLSLQAIDKTEDGNKLVVAGIGSKWSIGIINLESVNDFYLLEEITSYLTVHGDYVIGANPNSTKNIFKLGLITSIRNENESFKINIYPNPTSGSVNINFDNPHANPISLNIYTMEGELIQELFDKYFKEPVFNKSFDIGSNPSGVYLLEIQIGENKYVENVILEK